MTSTTATPTTSCPGWCVNHHPNVHIGTLNAADGLLAWLVQNDEPGCLPQIVVTGARRRKGHFLPLAEAVEWADDFADLHAPQLAATVRRLAEAGQAELAHAAGGE